VLTLAISRNPNLVVRVDQKSDGVMMDVLKKLTEVLGIRNLQSTVPVKIKPED